MDLKFAPTYKVRVQSSKAAKKSEGRGTLGQVFLIVFLDMIGFSILFPLFPAMLDFYVENEGPNSAIGELAGWLGDRTGDERAAVIALFGGILGSIYSLLQFVFAPIWGGLSDRIGRRPTLLVTLAGTAAGYLMWLFAGTFALLVVSRLIGGIAAGNISTASAVIADTTSGKDRAKGMGILGAGIGLGFIFGPAIGGLASLIDLEASLGWPGLTPFSAAAAIALVLAVLNLLWVGAKFKESHPVEKRGAGADRSWAPFAKLRSLGIPGVGLANWTYFLYLIAFSAMEFTLTFLAADRFGYGPGQLAWMFVFIGLTIALIQGGVVRRMVPKKGEKRVALYGLALLLPGLVLVGVAMSVPLLYVGLGLMAVGSALAMPTLGALVSRYAPAESQGLVLGSFRSAGALARAVGPVLGGLLYWKFGAASPYLAGAAFLLIPLLLALKLPPLPESEPQG